METNFLKKGKSKINFVQSTLWNNSALPTAFSGTVQSLLKQFSPDGCPVPLSSFWEFSLCGSQCDMGVSAIPWQDFCSSPGQICVPVILSVHLEYVLLHATRIVIVNMHI